MIFFEMKLGYMEQALVLLFMKAIEYLQNTMNHLDENDEVKETKETQKCDCQRDSLTSSQEIMFDDKKDFSDTTSRYTNV